MMNDPKEILVDVRKSYRLLHDYQRLVMDACSFVGNQLGLEYAGGHQKLSNTPPQYGKGKLDLWAWDWLGMVAYEMHFLKSIPEGRVKFSILHLADTAACKVSRSTEPNPREFDAAGQSQSLLVFLLCVDADIEQATLWNFGFFGQDEQRREFVEKCEEVTMTGVSFDQGAMKVLAVPVDRVFTESSAREVVEKLQRQFPELGQEAPPKTELNH